MRELSPLFVKRVVVLCVLLLAGCYGGKFVKMPINADISSKRLDTLKTQQEQMLQTLQKVTEALQEEREERLRRNAETASKFDDIEETLGILSSKIDDSLQLINDARAFRSSGQVQARSRASDTLRSSETDSTGARVTAGDAAQEDKLFNSAYMDLTLGNYSLAIQGFKNYLARYAGGVHLPDVHYYLGECYYSTDKYLEAVGEYQFVIKEFPKSRLVPSAYLKSGLCYMELEEFSLAEQHFRELISRFPHSEEAEHAKAALKDIGG
jgi:tol-pal system protein YbgF